jgi:hypothetical protein
LGYPAAEGRSLDTQLSLFDQSREELEVLRSRLAVQEKRPESGAGVLSAMLETLASHLNLERDEQRDSSTLLGAIVEEGEKRPRRTGSWRRR